MARVKVSVAENLVGTEGLKLARGLTLVTHNTCEFERVADLRLADWQ